MIEAVDTFIKKRRAGVLLHPTSLPNGDLGADAERFLDFVRDAGLSVWQVLPLGPTHADGSPYHCLSVHAISPALISLERLVQQQWLDRLPATNDTGARRAALAAAYAGMSANGGEHRAAYRSFCEQHAAWLDDYALFQALREEGDEQPWWQWLPDVRDRKPAALVAAAKRLNGRLEEIRFEQFVAVSQWEQLRDAARNRGVLLLGDMPIFVARDSAEVWAHHDCFKLDAAGEPTVVAGVPPDYFSATGQYWGNPLYDWDAMRLQGFRWWMARMETELSRFDLVRVDHFRGFESCWEIPANETTAVNGKWVNVPGAELFDALLARFGRLPLVAEDLGLITEAVHALRERYGMPGMAVLQFAFDDGADNPYLPHNIKVDTVVYTGTHDNDTTLSWFQNLSAQQQLRVVDYLGYLHEPMPWPLIRTALMSVARLAVIPMQDLLGLGRGHRMNTPGTASGNWSWRFAWDEVAPDLVSGMKRLVGLYGRE